MRTRNIGIVVLGAVLGTALGLTPAHALPSADTTMSILGATQGACSNGSAAWTIDASVTITNTAEEPDVIRSVFYNATGETAAAQIIDDGGLVVGETVPAGESRTYTPTVQATIPCDADSSTLFVNYELVGRDNKVFREGAEFLAQGTAVPTGAVGAIGFGLAALVAVGLATRKRRTAPAKVTVGA